MGPQLSSCEWCPTLFKAKWLVELMVVVQVGWTQVGYAGSWSSFSKGLLGEVGVGFFFSTLPLLPQTLIQIRATTRIQTDGGVEGSGGEAGINFYFPLFSRLCSKVTFSERLPHTL
jgi:hypothetical protein